MPRKNKQKGRGIGKYVLEGVGGFLGSEFGPAGVIVGKVLGGKAGEMIGLGKPTKYQVNFDVGNRSGGVVAPNGFNPNQMTRVVGSRSYETIPKYLKGGALITHPSVGGMSTGIIL
jgi:hypothetical protein